MKEPQRGVRRTELPFLVRVPLGQPEERETFDVGLQCSVCEIKTFQGLTVVNRSFANWLLSIAFTMLWLRTLMLIKFCPFRTHFPLKSSKEKWSPTYTHPQACLWQQEFSPEQLCIDISKPQRLYHQFSYYLATESFLDYFEHSKDRQAETRSLNSVFFCLLNL